MIYLDDLKILNGENTMKFDPYNLVYTINVKSDVEFLQLEYVNNFENVNVEIENNKNFIDGENIVYIKLTDLNNKMTYKLIVNKEAAHTVFNEVILDNTDEKPYQKWEGYSVEYLILICTLLILFTFKLLFFKKKK